MPSFQTFTRKQECTIAQKNQDLARDNMHYLGLHLIGVQPQVAVQSIINIIASRIPAARPEGSLFAVPGFLSLCVRKLHSPAEEDDEENKEKTKTKKMKKKKDEEKEKENGKETKKKEKVATRESERETET